MKTKLLVALLVFVGFEAGAQIDPVDKKGIAIGGYDVIAYFLPGKATKGSENNASSFHGVTYLFASPENKKIFDRNPEIYLPQYDGYCALAVSYGKKISIDPQTFKIVDNKLYLFYRGNASGKKVNSLETWNRNEPHLLKKADELWPDVKKKKFRESESL